MENEITRTSKEILEELDYLLDELNKYSEYKLDLSDEDLILAIKAHIERHIPKKAYNSFGDNYTCPSCGYITKLGTGDRYCRFCGQRFDIKESKNDE